MDNAPALVLASASPRRRELLGRAGLAFEVVPSTVDEDALAPGLPTRRLAAYLARAKAIEIATRRADALVLGADTVVWLRGQSLAKPGDAAEARSMLQLLRGREHRVITAVCLLAPGARRPAVARAVTSVRLRDLADAEIEASIARGDPFDKAGAYAIQDSTLDPVESYRGCYCNVVGLPLATLAGLLGRFGLRLQRRPLPQCSACSLWPHESVEARG